MDGVGGVKGALQTSHTKKRTSVIKPKQGEGEDGQWVEERDGGKEYEA